MRDTTLKRKPHVLIVEDDIGDANLIRWQLLERDPEAFEVTLADSVAQTRQLLEQGLCPDVTLLDLNLPDSRGIETVEHGRNLLDGPLVVLTGMEDSRIIEQAIAHGADDYLCKGADGGSLRKAVRYALLRHQRDANDRLAATVFGHVSDGVVITDPQGKIIDVNIAFTQITGYRREEVVGKNPRLLKSGKHPAAFYQSLWQTLTEQGNWAGEIWNRRKNGELYIERLAINAVRGERGDVQHYVGLFSDITTEKEYERQLKHIAHYDALTGLPNRILLADRLEQALRQARRDGLRVALIYLDLDGFKAINDKHGHACGDELLIAVAKRIQNSLREQDTVARIGGDEFVVILPQLQDIEASLPLFERILAAAAEPVHQNDKTLQVSASLGVTYYPQVEEIGADQLLRQADQAMYQAKLAGKNTCHIFDLEHDRSLRGHHDSLERIRLALQQEELRLYYQPQVNMRSGALLGVEALIRWQHPKKGLLPPSTFLPVVEGHPLEREIGAWVMETAMRQLAEWGDEAVPISINVCARRLQSQDFVDEIHALLGRYPTVSPEMLEFEILESSALEDIQQVGLVIAQCQKLGIRFALDDFGTGYSSLTYLRQLHIDTLKIDQGFVDGMPYEPDDLAIVRSVIGLAWAFRREVIAEGVETLEHGHMLLALGCERAQGYAIGYPMPSRDLARWRNEWQPVPDWRQQGTLPQDSQSVLYASVVHRAWIAAISAHLHDEHSEPPPQNHHECRFGIWFDQEARARYGDLPVLHDIDRHHQALHQIANRLLQFKRAGQTQQAISELPRLYAMQDELLAWLSHLLAQESRQQPVFGKWANEPEQMGGRA